MIKKIIGGIMAGVGALGTFFCGQDWFSIATGRFVCYDAQGNIVGPGRSAVLTVIAAAVMIGGIVLLVYGIKQGKKVKE